MIGSRLVIVGVLVAGCSGAGDDSSPFDSAMESATGSTTSPSDATTSPPSTTSGAGTGMGSSSDGADADSGTGVKFDLDNPDAPGGIATGCDKVDLLFVIDDSGSMSDNQDKLTAAFPGMAQTIDDTLVAQQGIDYRIGVISSNITDEMMCLFGALCGPGYLGRLQHTEGRVACSDLPAGRWIEGSEGAAAVGDQFTCVASLRQAQDFNGVPSGGSEAPLEATRMALVDRVSDVEQYNLGFLREDALLVLVLVTDEDDQSVWMTPTNWPLFGGPGPIAPVADFHDMLVQLKGGHPENLVAVAISGPQAGGGDTSAPRIHAFLDLFAPNSYWSNISGSDYSAPLQEALELIQGSCENFIPPAG